MKGISIRPMISADQAAVENICIETAPPFLCSNDKRREYTLLMYNRYYTRVLQHSFVAVNESDKPVGYILCAPDYKSINRIFSEKSLQISAGSVSSVLYQHAVKSALFLSTQRNILHTCILIFYLRIRDGI